MSAEIVNLRRVRKAKARRQEEERAAENRVAFGRTKAERTAARADAALDARRLDAHRREASTAGAVDGADAPVQSAVSSQSTPWDQSAPASRAARQDGSESAPAPSDSARADAPGEGAP